MRKFLTKPKALQLLSVDKESELLRLLPDVAKLKNVPQPIEYHAEGDVFVHTRLAVESLPKNVDERVLWGVLLHDVGKPETTKFFQGRWRAHGHAELGAKKARQILLALGREDIAEDVSWLVRHHHFVLSWNLGIRENLSKKQRRFCAQPLFHLLCEVVQADAAGSWGGSDKGQQLELILVRLNNDSEI